MLIAWQEKAKRYLEKSLGTQLSVVGEPDNEDVTFQDPQGSLINVYKTEAAAYGAAVENIRSSWEDVKDEYQNIYANHPEAFFVPEGTIVKIIEETCGHLYHTKLPDLVYNYNITGDLGDKAKQAVADLDYNTERQQKAEAGMMKASTAERNFYTSELERLKREYTVLIKDWKKVYNEVFKYVYDIERANVEQEVRKDPIGYVRDSLGKDDPISSGFVQIKPEEASEIILGAEGGMDVFLGGEGYTIPGGHYVVPQ
jgi:hypothetical protein